MNLWRSIVQDRDLPLWQFLIRLGGVIFLPLLSVILGLYVFLEVPQVGDLLFDVKKDSLAGTAFWVAFFLSCYLFWANPVQFCARILILQNLDFLHIDRDKKEKYKLCVVYIPKALKFLSFAAILVGVTSALTNIPSLSSNDPLHALVIDHVRILFVLSAIAAILVVIYNFFLVTNYGFMSRFLRYFPKTFRSILLSFEKFIYKWDGTPKDDSVYLESRRPDFISEKDYGWLQRSKVFMVLYIALFIVFMFAIWALHFFYDRLPDVVGREFPDIFSMRRAIFLPLALGGWVPFVSLLAFLSNRSKRPVILYVASAVVIVGIFLNDGHTVRLVILGNSHAGTQSATQQGPSERAPVDAALTMRKAIDIWECENRCHATASKCRADLQSKQTLKSCPRPIIVAAEGGASRSAFFTASVLAQIDRLSSAVNREENSQPSVLSVFDAATIAVPAAAGPTRPAGTNPGPNGSPFRRQLFAISAVSGGALGAAAISAAWRYEGENFPSKGDNFQRLWYRSVEEKEPFKNLRGEEEKSLLQSALTEDFLTPTFTALYARDLLRLSSLPHVSDRAVALEESWEESFKRAFNRSYFDEGFANFGPDPVALTWQPILVLNATSMETGRRVLISPLFTVENFKTDNRLFARYFERLEKTSDGYTKKYPVFTDAYNLYELLCDDRETNPVGFDRLVSALPKEFYPPSQAVCGATKDFRGRRNETQYRRYLTTGDTRETPRDREWPKTYDLRLSTAVGLAARFPLISPHGSVRNMTGQLIDRVVDGGYFDSSGAVTALEIASAIRTISTEPGADVSPLKPFIIEISSDPELFPEACAANQATREPSKPDAADYDVLGTFDDPFTIAKTRIARGYHTILRLRAQMQDLNKEGDGAVGDEQSHAFFRVCPQPRESLEAVLFAAAGNKSQAAASAASGSARGDRQLRDKPSSWKSLAMSWWLSPPVQKYLDGQICERQNRQPWIETAKLFRATNAPENEIETGSRRRDWRSIEQTICPRLALPAEPLAKAAAADLPGAR